MTELLSPAQLQQRRNAARARWDKARRAAQIAAGGGAGGAAAGLGAAKLLTLLRQRALAAKDQALDPLRPEFTRHNQRTSFINARAEAARAGLRQKGFVQNAARGFELKARAARQAARRQAEHLATQSEFHFDPSTGEIERVPLDVPGETRRADAATALHAEQAERFARTAADLRAHGREGYYVDRPGGVQEPRVEEYQRERRGREELILSARQRQRFEDYFAMGAEQQPLDEPGAWPLHDMGIRSIADLEAHIRDLPRGERQGFAALLRQERLPQVRLHRSRHRAPVRNARRVIPPHRAWVPAHPLPRVRAGLRAELDADIEARRSAKQAEEDERHEAKSFYDRLNIHRANRVLPFLNAHRPEGRIVRYGVLGTAIGAGALAGAFAVARAERKRDDRASEKRENSLAKAADDADTDTRRKRKPRDLPLFERAGLVEDKLAAGIGRAFARWKDAATPEAIASGALLDQLDAPLAEGMKPLDEASEAGVTAPSRVQPKLLHFAFNLRNKAVQRYAEHYRYGRVREITDAQRRNIRQIIVAATQTGAPPATIAQRVRDVVGLTAHQASIVANYRQMLDLGDPRALTYTLRDHRYDGQVRTTLDQGELLSPSLVDTLVDAYTRRSIAHRAMTIARTESLRAANNGQIQALAGYLDKNPRFTVAKTWIATEDDRTRPDHAGLHRQTVLGLDTPFVCDSGARLRWPHDPNGAPNEVIGCRCTLMTALVPRDAAVRHGADAYGTPTPHFWEGPRAPFEELFRPQPA